MTTAVTRATPERRRFTVDDCRAMVKAGILAPEEKVELRNGEIFVCRASAQYRTIADHDAGPAAGATSADDVVLASVDTWQGGEVIGKLGKALGAEYAPRRFTVEEYYAMVEAGILAPDERVELLAGEIIKMAPIGSRHAYSVTRFTEVFFEQLGRRVTIRVQNPVRIATGNEPEPDIAILRRKDDGYAYEHPGAEDVILLVEVADSSVEFDRRHKLPVYAMHGIPEVWLGDINTRIVEVYDEPIAGGYARMKVYGSDDSLVSETFTGLLIPVSEVMPE